MDTNILEEMNLIKNIALILNIDEVDLFIKESLYNVEILSNIPDTFSVKSENILLFNDLIKDDFQIDFLYCNISEKTLNKNFNISDVYEFIEIINDKLEDLDYTDDEDRQVIDSFKIKIYIRKEIKEQIEVKIEELKMDLEDLDKEKVLEIAKKKAKQIQDKAEEIVDLAIEKGTPVLEKAASSVREKAIIMTKDVLKKLESK